MCQSQRAIEIEREGMGDKKTPGLEIRAEIFSVSGAPLSTFRKPYYEAEAKRREAMTEERHP